MSKIVQAVAPFADMATGSIEDLARRLHVDPVLVAAGLGLGLAGLIVLAEAAPEIALGCTALCGPILDLTAPILALELIDMLDTTTFLTLYGTNITIAADIGATAIAGVESVRLAGVVEREIISAEASEFALGRLMRAVKMCTKENSFTPDTPVLLADGTVKPINEVRDGEKQLVDLTISDSPTSG